MRSVRQSLRLGHLVSFLEHENTVKSQSLLFKPDCVYTPPFYIYQNLESSAHLRTCNHHIYN